MDGQVLGGGVIVAVSVLLWLVYLVPSWYERRQYDAAERNAVRLNQALRVLAETSETPDEVRLELTTRTAQAQQREAKRALAERERLAKLAAAEREQAAVEEARSELVAARSLAAGTVLTEVHLGMKKPGTGIPAERLSSVLGRRLRRSLEADDQISVDDLELLGPFRNVVGTPAGH